MGHQQDTGAKAFRGITHATTSLTQGAGMHPHKSPTQEISANAVKEGRS
jgi:hypothetical protein